MVIAKGVNFVWCEKICIFDIRVGITYGVRGISRVKGSEVRMIHVMYSTTNT